MSAAAAPQKPEPNSNGSSALSEVKPFVRPIHVNVDDRVDVRCTYAQKGLAWDVDGGWIA